MKKWLLFILCLVCITSNCSFASTQQELLKDKQIILNDFVKDNKTLTYTEFKNALKNTENELYSIHRMKNADHSCYSNGVIKQIKIIKPDGSITYEYFNIYGISVGTLTYKNNKLISTSRPEPNSQIDQQIVSSNNESYISNSNDVSGAKNSNMDFTYDRYGKVSRIGDKSVAYDRYGKVSRIGNESVTYDRYGKVSRIGNESVTYDRYGKVSRIGDKSVTYDRYGKVSRISK